MKVTKEKAAENREALVSAAGRLFRERGIDGVGVAEIGKTAGLTHGALYAQFSSKDALAAEALAYGLARSNAAMTRGVDERHESPLTHYLDFYMSTERRDDMVNSCAMAASASEIARQDEAVSASFSNGFLETVAIVEAALGDGASDIDAHHRALAIVSAMIGGIAVARATKKSRPDLSDQVLDAVRRMVGEIGGEPPKKAVPKKKARPAKPHPEPR